MNDFFEKDGYVLRLAKKVDALDYYQNNFNPLDSEVARFTGSKTSYTQEEVVSFFKQCIDAKNRYDFVIVEPEGHIIGESILNEIDTDLKCANYRVALFHNNSRNCGIGSWAIKNTLAFAFDTLKLHRVELEVFSFNPRAIHSYKKAGFKQEGILKDSIKDGDNYGDTILMAILEDDWKNQKQEIIMDEYSYRCGVMDCFCEMVKAGVKKIALAHPFKTKQDRDSYLGFVEKITNQYHIRYFLDDDPLITDLFAMSMNLNTYNIIFYRNDEDIKKYQELKEEKRQALKNNKYEQVRNTLAYQFGYLLGYSDKTIAEYIKQNNEKEKATL